MTRSRSSAKEAGTKHENHVVAYLNETLGTDRIERRARNGKRDRGDVSGVFTLDGRRVVIECKDVARLDLAGWVEEAQVEKGHDDAAVGVVVHKRRKYGPANMGGTYVTMTLADFATLLGGTP